MYCFEIPGLIIFLLCILFYILFPINRDRFLFGSKSWRGALIFSCCFVGGLILSISLINHVCHDSNISHISPKNLVNWDSSSNNNYSKEFTEMTDPCTNNELNKEQAISNEDDREFEKDNFYAIISQFADPGNIPSAKGNSRRWAILLAFLGIFFLSGLLISSLVTLLSKKSDKWKDGLIRYNRCLNKYVVIVGVNEQTATIVKQSLRKNGVRYVLIQTRQNVQQARERLDLNLDFAEERRVIFYYGERTSREDVEALHLEKAIEVFVLGEDMNFENEEDHDAFNINCLEHITKIPGSRGGSEGKRLKCHVNFEYQSTFTAFKAAHFYQSLDKVIEFIPFNIHEIWSKKVLVDNFAIVQKEKKGEFDVQKYYPIDSYIGEDKMRHGITYECNKRVHIVIVGMNQMGTALGLQAALLAHYPNFMRDKSLRTTITFIDDHAKEEGEFFRGRFETLFNLCRHRTVICGKEELDYSKAEDGYEDPLKEGPYSYLNMDYGNFLDVQWEFIQGNIASNEIKKYINDIAMDANKVVTIAICFNHPQKSIAAALYLPGQVFRRANQVLVYQRNSFDMLNKVAEGEKEWKRYENLFPFGMIENSYTGDALENSVAVLNHFLASKKYDKDTIQSLRNFDKNLIPGIRKLWAELGMVEKQYYLNLSESIFSKIRSMGVEYNGDPSLVDNALQISRQKEAMAYSEHLRWLLERLTMGFRPLNEYEFNKYKNKEASKEFFQKNHRAHLSICSKERLREIDSDSKKDENIIENLPMVLKCAEWFSAARLTDIDKHTGILKEFFIHSRKELKMRFVPGGKRGYWTDGLEEDKLLCDHSYWMSATPLTRYQWYLVTGKDKPSRIKRNMPATGISKSDIDDFLLILRKKTGLYFDLPTISEWGHAARLSSSYLYKYQKKHWHWIIRHTTGRPSSSVRGYHNRFLQKNKLGLYNMLGNVWEWTRTEEETHKNCFFFCGGSWRFKDKECDILNEEPYWYTYWAPMLRSDDIGCRLIWKFDISEQSAESISAVLRAHKPIKANIEEQVNTWLENNMVTVKKGFFIMGTENKKETALKKNFPMKWIDEIAGDDETPSHIVQISEMQVSAVPVTQELWNYVMETDSKSNPASLIGDNYPQTNISYRCIKKKFLPKLNKIAKSIEGYNLADYEFRLLTEAEWEYVAKGGHTSHVNAALTKEYNEKGHLLDKEAIIKILDKIEPYTRYSGSNNADEVAWVNMNCIQPTKLKNPISKDFPIYDMSGNVWEWVDDFYQTDFYFRTKGDGAYAKKDEYHYLKQGFASDPICTDNSYSAHVFRGGSWLFSEVDCRCTRPNYWVDTDTDDDLGFRLAFSKKKKDRITL